MLIKIGKRIFLYYIEINYWNVIILNEGDNIMYKFIAIDLDGTLLNSYGEISNENKEALNKAIDKGVQIVLTSGRISKAIEYISNQIGRNNYLISGNGTTIYDLKNGVEIYNKCMSRETALKIIEIC